MAAPVRAECRTVGDGTWSGAAPFDASAGAAVWECDGGAAPSADDDFEIGSGRSVLVSAQLGTAEAPLTGRIRVADGGRLDFAPNVDIHHHGDLYYRNGSDGRLRGRVLAGAGLPPSISHPEPTRIRIEWPDGPPWPLCDGVLEACGPGTVHSARTVPGEAHPPTLLYFEWEKAGGPPPPGIPPDGRVTLAPVYDPGQWLPVAAVDDADGDGELETLELALPRSGPNEGDRYFGAAGAAPGRATADGRGRCNECMDNGGSPAGLVSTSGLSLRNAVGEGAWRLADPPYRRQVEPGTGKVRWELRLDPAAEPFDSDGEFEGFLACRRPFAGAPPPAPEEEWCARIIKAEADAHGGAGEIIVVWRDPRGALAAGDPLDVYYSKPSAGDLVVPVNAVRYHGGRSARLIVQETSGLGRSEPLRGVWFDAMGPDFPSGAALEFRNGFGLRLDLVFIEHQGGDTAGGKALGLWLNSASGGEDRFEDVRVERFSYRMPDARIELSAETPFTPVAFRVTAARGAATSTPETVSVWEDVAVRKLRGENAGAAIGMAQGGQIRNCPDGLLFQDVLALHGRDARDDRARVDQEVLEFRGAAEGCHSHRIAVVGSTTGVEMLPRCHACPDSHDRHYWSSVVVFGSRDGVAVGAGADVSHRGWLLNYLTDGDLAPNQQYAYGARMDWFEDGSGRGVPGLWSCQSNVGLFQVGSAPESTPIEIAQDCREDRDLLWLDSWSSNLVRDDVFAQLSGFDVAPRSLQVSGILYHVRPESPRTLFFRGLRPGESVSATFDHMTLLSGRSGSLFEARSYPFAEGDVRFGPDVFAVGARPIEQAAPAPTPLFQDGEGAVLEAWARDLPAAATTGWNRDPEPFADASPAFGDYVDPPPVPIAFGPPVSPACANAPGARPEATAECSPETALPRWSGPVVYDWPFAWATVDPVPGYRRASPRIELLPDHFVAAAGGTADADADGLPDVLDNCPLAPNGLLGGGSDQRDADRDGVGDACECGDASGDGLVDALDARRIQRCVVGLFRCAPLCDADGDGFCTASDARRVQRVAVGLLEKGDLRCALREP